MHPRVPRFSARFFFNATATTEIYTLSLHDALPILASPQAKEVSSQIFGVRGDEIILFDQPRSEEHTSELQSLRHLVCRLLLEKKKKKKEAEYRQRDRDENTDPNKRRSERHAPRRRR